MIIFEYGYNLNFENLKMSRDIDKIKRNGIIWCRNVIAQVAAQDSDNLLTILSSGMLRFDPEERFSAKVRLTKVEENPSLWVNKSFGSQGNTDNFGSAKRGNFLDQTSQPSGPRSENSKKIPALGKQPSLTVDPHTLKLPSISPFTESQYHAYPTKTLKPIRIPKSPGSPTPEMREMVRAILTGLRVGTAAAESSDISDWICLICQEMELLKITRLDLDEDGEIMFVLAQLDSYQLAVAAFSKEDREQSFDNIASCLLSGMRRHISSQKPSFLDEYELFDGLGDYEWD